MSHPTTEPSELTAPQLPFCIAMSDHKSHQSPQPSQQLHDNPLLRLAFFIMGFVFVGLGILGIILPGMPTTVFILLAGYCWAKSSRRFHAWLMNHKVFGKMLRDWQERRAMPRFAKYLAWSMMSVSCVFLFWRLPEDKLWVAVLTSTICLATAVWMYRLPDA